MLQRSWTAVFQSLGYKTGTKNHFWAAGSRPWWSGREQPICNTLNLIAPVCDSVLQLPDVAHGQVPSEEEYSCMIKIFL